MSYSEPIRIATRKSPLALRQSELVAESIRERFGVEVTLIPMTTVGDQRLDWSLPQQGGKGVFTKELERAILDGRADLAVHSAKDMPVENPDGLAISAFLEREDPRDVLVLRSDSERVIKLASGSPRRMSQLKTQFPSVKWCEIRGNVETRLKKIAEEKVADGTIIAAAGLKRLSIKQYPGLVFEFLATDRMVPAPGQGSIAVQSRLEESHKFSALGHAETEKAVQLERKILDVMGGGCQVALGAHVNGSILSFYHQKSGILKINYEDISESDLFLFLKDKTK